MYTAHEYVQCKNHIWHTAAKWSYQAASLPAPEYPGRGTTTIQKRTSFEGRIQICAVPPPDCAICYVMMKPLNPVIGGPCAAATNDDILILHPRHSLTPTVLDESCAGTARVHDKPLAEPGLLLGQHSLSFSTVQVLVDSIHYNCEDQAPFLHTLVYKQTTHITNIILDTQRPALVALHDNETRNSAGPSLFLLLDTTFQSSTARVRW